MGKTRRAESRRLYDRNAPLFGMMEAVMDWMGGRVWRVNLWKSIPPGRLLEVGVGTGKNIPLHPARGQVTAVDISPRMLIRAKRKALRRAKAGGAIPWLVVADAEALPFGDGVFDGAVATFVFCSVDDPVAGLKELRRVVRPAGRLAMLEHVLSRKKWLAWWMNRMDRVARFVAGAHINRDTVANVRAADWGVEQDLNLQGDVVKRIEAVR